MERGEWEDDPDYPRAPLPQHERTWRHPSEHGATAWTQSEPPLVVGKGLSVATGTVGAVLAVGLLWLMIPHNNRNGSGVAEVSSTVRTVGQDFSLLETTAPIIVGAPVPSFTEDDRNAGSRDTDAGPVSTATPGSGTTARTLLSSSSLVVTDDSDDPASDGTTVDTAGESETSASDPDASAPSTSTATSGSNGGASNNTTASSSPGTGGGSTASTLSSIVVTPTTSTATTGPTNSTGPATTAPGTSTTPTTRPPAVQFAGAPVAVALAPGRFVATTAAGVGQQSTVNVQLSTGNTVVADVVSVDTGSGIAVLSIPSDVQTPLIETSKAPTPATAATLVDAPETPVSIYNDSAGTQISYDPSVVLPEGSMLVDTSNRLIGMCTKSANGAHVVDAQSLLKAINTAIANDKPYLGLRAAPAPGSSDLVVSEVSADGPAFAAAIAVGDTIRSFDGLAVYTVEGLKWAVTSHRPGDVVTLSVQKAGAAAPIDVAVTLTANPGSF